MSSKSFRTGSGDRGYTLVELSIVLAISGPLLMAVVSSALVQMRSTRITRLEELYKRTLEAVATTYSSQTSFSGLTTRQLAAFGAFTGAPVFNARTDQVAVEHAFGGRLSVNAVGNGATDLPLAWGAYFDGLPVSVCGDVLPALEPIADALVVMPAGQLTAWPSQLTFNPGSNSFSAGNPTLSFVKNINSPWSPTLAGTTCGNVGSNFAVLVLKVKVI